MRWIFQEGTKKYYNEFSGNNVRFAAVNNELWLKEVEKYDVTIMNLANGDMVGHTGVYEAAKQAVEDMDICITKIYNKVEELNGTLIIIADHGNTYLTISSP